MRTEEEVDKMIESMVDRTKGKYITQGVSFNKGCPRQMNLLKVALMSSASFSGLAKELLASSLTNERVGHLNNNVGNNTISHNTSSVNSVGNFI